jgi:hypothetical protein
MATHHEGAQRVGGVAHRAAVVHHHHQLAGAVAVHLQLQQALVVGARILHRQLAADGWQVLVQHLHVHGQPSIDHFVCWQGCSLHDEPADAQEGKAQASAQAIGKLQPGAALWRAYVLPALP